MGKVPGRILLATLGVAIILAGVGLFIFSGVYNVAATKQHGAAFRWLVSTAMKRSVKAHAGEIQRPDLIDKNLLSHGAKHFKTMCVTCHGEPGGNPSEIGKGLNPKAPELSEAASRWTDFELHWITKNGIKMTGMPAFGVTHDDKEIWSLVAFIRAMSGKNANAYHRLVDSLESRGHENHDEPKTDRDGQVPWKKKSLF